MRTIRRVVGALGLAYVIISGASAVAGPPFVVPGHEGPPKTESERHYVTLLHDLNNRDRLAQYAEQTLHSEALILDSDRDPADVALRRTRTLLSDIQRMPSSPDLTALRRDLEEIRNAAAGVPVAERETRFKLFERICRLRRRIAFSNPLLDFEQIVFIKRHRALFNHMCDQYYGMAATPGGGLYVLSDAFGSEPQVRDLLADNVVQRGRLKGQKLAGGPTTPPQVSFDGMGNRRGEDVGGGTFLSPDLSYDGNTILFAYVENKGDVRHRHHTDPARGHWAEGRCYHIFRVDADGSNLEQLTDGTWNDFDPCWLPNGSDRLHQRAARRLPPLRPRLPDLHTVRHGR